MKKHFKALLPVLLLTGLLFGLSMTTSAADSQEGYWVEQDGQWWFDCVDTDWYPSNGLYKINGTEYAFDQWGYMVTGWWKDSYGSYYYFDRTSGAMQKGWILDYGTWYYLDPDYGYMYSDGIYQINGTDYWFKSDGSMVAGWYFYDFDPNDNYDGAWYYYNSDGSAYNGWLLENGYWYYIFDSVMLKGTFFSPEVNEPTWVFDDAGHLVSGGWNWIINPYYTKGGFWTYTNANGSGYDGWLWENGYWYYIVNGYMVANDTILDATNTSYALDNAGHLITSEGWHLLSNEDYSLSFWVYTYSNGSTPQNDWKLINGKWYYFDSFGYMLSNGTYTIDGKDYIFDSSGAQIG